MSPRRVQQVRCKLQVEHLESRIALAADVFATLSSAGNLVISGDTTVNDISLFTDGSGNLMIQGNNGSEIAVNGQTSSEATLPIPVGGLRNVTINLGTAVTNLADPRGQAVADVVRIDGLDITGRLSIRGSQAGVVIID